MEYDRCNLADDERNDTMTNLANNNNMMSCGLDEICSKWLGTYDFVPRTPREHYLQKVSQEMYEIAAKTKRSIL